MAPKARLRLKKQTLEERLEKLAGEVVEISTISGIVEGLVKKVCPSFIEIVEQPETASIEPNPVIVPTKAIGYIRISGI